VCVGVDIRAAIFQLAYVLCVCLCLCLQCVCVSVYWGGETETVGAPFPVSSIPSSSMSNRCRRCAIAPEIKGGLT
jgi:hypothetical protein